MPSDHTAGGHVQAQAVESGKYSAPNFAQRQAGTRHRRQVATCAWSHELTCAPCMYAVPKLTGAAIGGDLRTAMCTRCDDVPLWLPMQQLCLYM
jgi:hypothetical protein